MNIQYIYHRQPLTHHRSKGVFGPTLVFLSSKPFPGHWETVGTRPISFTSSTFGSPLLVSVRTSGSCCPCAEGSRSGQGPPTGRRRRKGRWSGGVPWSLWSTNPPYGLSLYSQQRCVIAIIRRTRPRLVVSLLHSYNTLNSRLPPARSSYDLDFPRRQVPGSSRHRPSRHDRTCARFVVGTHRRPRRVQHLCVEVSPPHVPESFCRKRNHLQPDVAFWEVHQRNSLVIRVTPREYRGGDFVSLSDGVRVPRPLSSPELRRRLRGQVLPRLG